MNGHHHFVTWPLVNRLSFNDNIFVAAVAHQKVWVAVIVKVGNTFKVKTSIVVNFHSQLLLIIVSDIRRNGFHVDVNLFRIAQSNVPIAIHVEIAYCACFLIIAEFLFSCFQRSVACFSCVKIAYEIYFSVVVVV